ncbi:hypothetical protein L226DRAFT_513609 [Lentinus tigrinus ALCF2SS1-7]|uniref:EamA domain-containing protein n=1 Tax=Lentinus tigrinus ALCF2SS1-6 TaxID=1328759 RepID=A0A5C2S244_9APHY|nr:hypothetical protein L227DRAFT_578519 [Lentinus tigrinus ALCF2SS1-6]RPD71201.1 hypothetical protein L226DRAFT_513609 [Lentinus tigrinus ALCF2SS1-7]
MPSTSRTPFIASTPDRTIFDADIPLSPQVSFIPAPTSTTSTNAGLSGFAKGWRQVASQVARWVGSIGEVVENNVGLLLVASSQLFFSLMNVGVKTLNSLDPPVPAMELILVRMAITWICCVTYMYFMSVPDPILGPKDVRYFLIQRGVFGFLGIYGLYYSLQYLSLSDATVLQFLSPIFTAIAGAVFLREAFSWREAAAGVTSLLGVVLIARPAFLFGSGLHDDSIAQGVDNVMPRMVAEVAADGSVTSAQRVTAVGIALLGAVGAAGAYTTIRHIGKRAHPLHNLVAYSVLCVIVTTIAMIVMRTPVVVPTRWEWLLTLLFIGLAGFTGQVLLTMGLQRETAGRGSIAVYGQIVFATIFERVFLHTVPSPLSVVGTCIIIGSALYVALTKKVEDDPKARPQSSDDPSVEEGLLDEHRDEEEASIPLSVVNPASKARSH